MKPTPKQTNLGYLKQVHSKSVKLILTYFILIVSNMYCHLLSKILSSESAFKLLAELRQNFLKSHRCQKNNPMNYLFFLKLVYHVSTELFIGLIKNFFKSRLSATKHTV